MERSFPTSAMFPANLRHRLSARTDPLSAGKGIRRSHRIRLRSLKNQAPRGGKDLGQGKKREIAGGTLRMAKTFRRAVRAKGEILNSTSAAGRSSWAARMGPKRAETGAQELGRPVTTVSNNAVEVQGGVSEEPLASSESVELGTRPGRGERQASRCLPDRAPETAAWIRATRRPLSGQSVVHAS